MIPRAFFLALMLGPLIAGPAQAQVWGRDAMPRIHQSEHERIGDYELIFSSRFQNDLGEPVDQTLIVKKAGTEVARFNGYTVGLRDADSAKPRNSLLDVVHGATAPGAPELIVETYSGSEHCCWGLHIAALGEAYQPLFDAKGSNLPLQVIDLRQDGQGEIVQHDLTFNEFWEPVGDSPSAEVLLASAGGLPYAADAALTQRWNERKTTAAPADTSDLGTLQQVLDLVYAGHADRAEAILTERWDGITRGTSLSFYGGPPDMMADLWCRVKKSPYADTVFAINRRPPPACDEARLTPYFRWLDHEKDKRKALTTK